MHKQMHLYKRALVLYRCGPEGAPESTKTLKVPHSHFKTHKIHLTVI